MRALASATDLEVAAIRRAAQLDKLNREQRAAVGQVRMDIVDDMRIVRAGLQQGTMTEQDIREMLESYEGRLLQFDEPQRFYLESKLAPFQSMLDDIALSQTAAGQPRTTTKCFRASRRESATCPQPAAAGRRCR